MGKSAVASMPSSSSSSSSAAAAAVVTLTVYILMLQPAASANVLLYPFSLCANSHLFNFEKLAGILTASGNQVTMLVSDNYRPTASTELRQVKFLYYRTSPLARPICNFETLEDFLETPLTDIITAFYSSTYASCDTLLEHRALLLRLKQQRFDLAIYEAVEQCSKILADYIDVPFIVFHTSGADNIYPRHPAYLPSMLTAYSDTMTLYQRVLNTLGYMIEKGIQYINFKHYQQLKLKHGLNATLHISESFNRASLRFILGDFGLDYVRPTQPSHVLVGGYIKSATAPIPQHIQEFLDRSGPNGVVVLSFGQMAREYGPKWRQLFAEALARLPYQVIWKYNETEPHGLGSNTLLVPWFNQADILTHPKVKVFVTHCGLNGAFETSNNGVPVVAIPLFADQFYQATKLTRHAQMGLQLDINTLTSEKLHNTILEVASNTIYQQNAQHVSFVMRNKPVSQKETILHWVNHVVHLKGAKHLHSRETDLTWIQYLLIDVACVLLVTSTLTMVTVVVSLKLLVVKICQRFPKPAGILHCAFIKT